MNRYGLKYASRQCIADANCSVPLVTFLYLAVSLGLSTVLYGLCAPYVDILYDPDYYEKVALFLQYYFLVLGVELLFSILSKVWTVGFQAFCLRLSRGMQTGAASMLTGFRLIFKVVWLTILIGLFTFLWSLLCILPGIVAFYRYKMAYYALLHDPSLTARQALQVSKRITRGHKLELFYLDISFIGWELLISITCGILGIWKRAYIETTYAHAFNWLMQLDEETQHGPDSQYWH